MSPLCLKPSTGFLSNSEKKAVITVSHQLPHDTWPVLSLWNPFQYPLSLSKHHSFFFCHIWYFIIPHAHQVYTYIPQGFSTCCSCFLKCIFPQSSPVNSLLSSVVTFSAMSPWLPYINCNPPFSFPDLLPDSIKVILFIFSSLFISSQNKAHKSRNIFVYYFILEPKPEYDN